MGPSKNLFHKNRSSHSLLNTQDPNDKHSYRSPSDSPLPSPAFPPQSSEHRYDDEDEGQGPHYAFSHPPSDEARFYQPAQPTRSQSQRSPTALNTNQPRITVGLSTPNSAVDEPPDHYYRRAPPQESIHPKEDGKKRRFFGLRSAKEPAGNVSGAAGKPTRNISVRRKEPLHEIRPDAGQHSSPQYWSSTHVSPTDDDDDNDNDNDDNDRLAEGGLHLSSSQSVPPPDKDPLRSPAFPPPISHHEYSQGKHQRDGANPSQNNRKTLDRQGSHQSAWDRASKQIQQHTHSEPGQPQTPALYHPSSASANSTSSGHLFHRRSPSEALHQQWQDQSSRPSSQQSLEPPNSAQDFRAPDSHHLRSNSSHISSVSHMQGSMGPPPPQQQQQQQQQPSQSRRSSEAPPSQQAGQSRDGPGYHSYAQNIQGVGVPSNAPPQYSGQLAPQGQNYRSTAQPSPMQQGNSDQGRGTTPPPNRSRDDLSDMDVAQLIARHDELQDKYRKVKKYYFDKDAQVQQLQNTLAHQRLAQSRTSLDDNEYSNRFSRLDGAINNLAFNIRREWRQVPPWLAPHVNRDAATNPTKEMTAIGRATISRWLVDELLDRYFHPALDPVLSTQLKMVERNLRKFAAPTPSDEEKDALLAKISNWRLSTLDGLQEVLAAPQTVDYRAILTETLVEKLVASLSMMLKEPAPPGLEGGVSMIVELAVGIAANLPLESRDVFVEYVVPGQFINESFMKIETGLPALTNPGDGPSEGNDAASLVSKQTEETGSIDSRETGNSNGNGNEDLPTQQSQQNQQQGQGASKKKGMFGGFMGSAGSKKGNIGAPLAGPGGSMQGPSGGGQGQLQGPKEERVRFSTFMAVEVRGRSVLVKAPVYVRE